MGRLTKLDGATILSLTARGVNRTAAMKMNDSALGLAGYTLAYGDNPSAWPCAEFSSYKDKHGKKLLSVNVKYATDFTVQKYFDGAEMVSKHYQGAVGIAYGICSALTFETVHLQYLNGTAKAKENTAKKLEVYKQALAIAWRKVYEGLGLAGYTPEANRFFELLNKASWLEDKKHKNNKEGKPNMIEYEELISELSEILGIAHLSTPKSITRAIVWGESIRHDRAAIEKGLPRLEWMSSAKKTKVTVLCALRAMGQGKNDGAKEALEISSMDYQPEEGEILPSSLMQEVSKMNVAENYACPWLAALLTSAAAVHKGASEYCFRMQQLEDEGY